MQFNITSDNRPVKIQQEEWFETCKDWEIKPNVFINPYDKTEFHMQEHIYKEFLNWKKNS
jgi:translation elongation factor EF-G